MKNYFPYSVANISAVGQEIPPRVLSPKGISRAHNDLSTLKAHPNITFPVISKFPEQSLPFRFPH